MIDHCFIAHFLEIIHQKKFEEAIKLLEKNPDLANSPLTPEIAEEGDNCDRVIHAVAQSRGAIPVLQWLLDHGVPVDQLDSDEGTPLHAAAEVGNVDSMQLLLERGANLEARNLDGLTPLDATYRVGRPLSEGFEFLLSRGAKPGLFIAIVWDRRDLVEELVRTQTPEQLKDRLGGKGDRGALYSYAVNPGIGPPAQIERNLEILRSLGIDW